MNGGALWLIAGLLLAALELIAPGFFLLWIGLALCGTGLLTGIFGLGWPGQLAFFSALAVAFVGLAARRRRTTPDTVNDPNVGLLGATCYALAFEAGEGRVRLRDGSWQARMADGGSPLEDEPLRVVGLDGTTLLVTRQRVG